MPALAPAAWQPDTAASRCRTRWERERASSPSAEAINAGTHTKGGHRGVEDAAAPEPSCPRGLGLRAKNTGQIGRLMFLQSLAAPVRRWMPPRLRGSRLRASQSALLSTELAAVPHFSPPLSLLHVSLPLFFQALNMYHMTE